MTTRKKEGVSPTREQGGTPLRLLIISFLQLALSFPAYVQSVWVTRLYRDDLRLIIFVLFVFQLFNLYEMGVWGSVDSDEKSLRLSSLNDLVPCSCFTDIEHKTVLQPFRGFDALPNIPEGMPILAKKYEFEFIHFRISGPAASGKRLARRCREDFFFFAGSRSLYEKSVDLNLKYIRSVNLVDHQLIYVYRPPYFYYSGKLREVPRGHLSFHTGRSSSHVSTI